MATHAIFDEAHFTVPRAKAPLAALALQNLGYHKQNETYVNGEFPSWKNVKITLHKDSVEPKMDAETGRMNIFTARDYTIIL